MEIRKRVLSFILVFALIGIILPSPQQAEAKSGIQTVTLGKSISVYKKGASYTSSDSSIIYVNDKGRVTGKKVGNAVITVKKNGKSSQIPVCVKKNQKKKAFTVCTDEILIKSKTLSFTKSPASSDDAAPGEQPENDKQDNETEETGLQETGSEETGSQETETEETGSQETGSEEDGSEKTDPGESGTEAAPQRVEFEAKITLKNTAKRAASKVILYGTAGEKELTFSFDKIGAGKTKTVTVKGEFDQEMSEEELEAAEIVLTKIDVTSNNMIQTYDFASEDMSLTYGTEDNTEPVFSGFIEKNSYNGNIPYQIVYSDQAEEYNFKKYVTATDDRDTKVKIQVDTSKVDFNKTGTYKVIYRATDSAGNTAKTYAKIGIRVATDLDSYCDTILSKITKSSWSNTRKARAIYSYTRGHISYTGKSDKSSWEKAAVDGIRYGRGDCFTYYAVARALLTRAGIPNIEVTRVAGHGHHWWGMVYVQGAFYHFDACPRRAGGRFCLVTDKQLKEYSRSHGNSHIWAYDKKPKSGTKVLSSIY